MATHEIIKLHTETIRETTWGLCKQFDAQNKRRSRVRLSNFITITLERLFGPAIENNFRNEWSAEVELFCQKYGYVA